jgi:predicted ATPase/DNA-binding SARP family transcriptional activator/Tfp pilus assembly protein PilF
MSSERWRIELLGGLRALRGDQVIARFRTRQTGALLAYLACYPQQMHLREALIDLLWADDGLDTGRNKLRQALTALRQQLEPPGVPEGSVLKADRKHVWLESSAIVTDVADFEAALQSAARSADPSEQAHIQAEAVSLYRGELLPDHEGAWIEGERRRLADVHQSTLRELVKRYVEAKDFDRALDYAHRSIRADRYHERAYRDLMRLYAKLERYTDALSLYRTLEQILRDERDERPSATTRKLAEELQAQVRSKAHARQTAPRDHLPPTFTQFFGREEETARLLAKLSPSQSLTSSTSRLITLTGIGGSGKTRLAIEVARKIADEFGGAVWFVSLADLMDTHLIAGAILSALELERSPTVAPLDQVAEFLNRQPSLLVLDNFEHLAEMGAGIVLTLLTRVAALVCLVTSRSKLALAGEDEFPVEPLPTPPPGVETPERLMLYASVSLFVDRAQAAHPKFKLMARNVGAVAKLCDRLDGIPLSIELAAARAQTLTLTQMLAQLTDRFDFLVNRRKDIAARHLSLYATIDWSFRLLSPELQKLFTRLAVFRGGCTYEMAATVCEESRALDYLTQLRLHSLVVTEEAGEEMRFRVLETLREFAAEQLPSEAVATLQRRHAEQYLALAEAADQQIGGPETETWLDRLENEHDNQRAALDWCLTVEGDGEIGLRLAERLWWFWLVRGYLTEGRERLHQVLARAEPLGRTAGRAKVLNGAGVLALNQADFATGLTYLEESLAIQRELGNKKGISATLNNLGVAVWSQGNYPEARLYYTESLDILRELEDREGIASTLNNLGNIAVNEGNYASARALHAESLAIKRELGDKGGIGSSLNTLGVITQEQGDYPTARSHFEDCLSLYRELGDKKNIASTLHNLGLVILRQGDYEAAHPVFEESLSLRRELEDKEGIAYALEGLGGMATAQGQATRAARLFGAAGSLRKAIGAPLPPNECGGYDQDIAVLRAALEEEGFEAAWAAGRAMTLEQAIAYALETEEES